VVFVVCSGHILLPLVERECLQWAPRPKYRSISSEPPPGLLDELRELRFEAKARRTVRMGL
jgi:hypothetical protein